MYDPRNLDVGHVIALALGGSFADGARLEHRRCNRSAGASLGNRIRGLRRTAQPATRRW
jgi:hypothetical protein